MARPPITATASITEKPDTISLPTPPHTYLGVAEALLSGVKILAAAPPPAAYSVALVAAHTLECLLKAFLYPNHPGKALKALGIRHNLKKLWEMAETEGLHVAVPAPDWVEQLSHLHNEPDYYLRYSTGVHAVVLPAAQPMAAELEELLKKIRLQLG